MQATWFNGLGEECSSKVYANFRNEDGESFVVVWNWRNREYIVKSVKDCHIM